MKCPSCGALYTIDEMQFMGSQDGYFLLSMTCTKCSLPVWVNLFAGEAPLRPVTDLTIMDMDLSTREPICANEVIEFSAFVRGFNGNFRSAFKR
jgi:hypothetical protein